MLNCQFGTVLEGRYRLVKKLGEGGYAQVWLARDTKLELDKALKIFTQPGLATSYYREVRALAALNHPGIVRVFDLHDANEPAFIDMEYCAGGSLEDILAKGPLPPEQVKPMLLELLEAMAAAHQTGVVHGDIKPRNILLDDQNKPRLADFGLAAALGEKRLSPGTLAYCPPENLETTQPGCGGDVFAAGVTAYRMLTERFPFELDAGGRPDYILRERPAGIDDQLWEWLQKSLDSDPNRRFTNSIKQRDFFKSKVEGTGWKGQMARHPVRTLAVVLLFVALLLQAVLLALLFFDKLPGRARVPAGYSLTINGTRQWHEGEMPAVHEGDFLQFYRPDSSLAFATFQKNGEKLRLTEKGGLAFYNGKLAGAKASQAEQLPAGQLRFLHMDTPLPANWRGAENLALHLEPSYPDSAVIKLPQASALVISKPGFNPARLKEQTHLQALDFSGSDSLHVERLPKLDSLRSLNLSNTGLKHLELLRPMSKLTSLNLDGNELKKTDTSRWPGLTSLSGGDSNQPALTGSHRPAWLWPVIIAVLTALLLSGLLYKILSGRRNDDDATVPKVPEAGDERFAEFDDKLKNENFWQPANDNAFTKLEELRPELGQTKAFTQREKALVKAGEQYLQQYCKQGLYEPVFLAARQSGELHPGGNWEHWQKKAQKQLQAGGEAVHFMRVRGGSFNRGDFAGVGLANARPRRVDLPPFALSATPVTNSQFVEFLREKGNNSEGGVNWLHLEGEHCRITYKNGEYQVVEPYGNFPVMEVSWYGALRFCEWLGGTLPSESQYEFAARNGGKSILYPWGNEPPGGRANYRRADNRWTAPRPVKSFDPSPLGLYDMAGNIFQWCADDYRYDDKDPGDGSKSLRGGCWSSPEKDLLTFARSGARPNLRNNMIGFRVARKGG